MSLLLRIIVVFLIILFSAYYTWISFMTMVFYINETPISSFAGFSINLISLCYVVKSKSYVSKFVCMLISFVSTMTLLATAIPQKDALDGGLWILSTIFLVGALSEIFRRLNVSAQ